MNHLAHNIALFLSRLIHLVLGSDSGDVVFNQVTWADIFAAILLLIVMIIGNSVVLVAMRREGLNASITYGPNHWRTLLFQVMDRPFLLLLWFYGIQLSLTPILMNLDTPARLLLDQAFSLGFFTVFLWLLFKLTGVLETGLHSWTARTKNKVDDLMVPLICRSVRVIVPVMGLFFTLPLIGLPQEYAGILSKSSSLMIVGTVAWILFQSVHLGEKAILSKYDLTAADNLQARKIYTQVHVLSKTVYFIISIFTIASMLMLFDEVRRFGASILASAGVIGIIVGFAAQRTIANLFAGFQLAMTQPIRLDDVVIVEGEWGRIEEITLSYVIVCIWDDRRLVVPLTYFIEKPFQNWTRSSAKLLGSVFVWVDYTLPINELRSALKHIIEDCKDWDKRFWNLQVTDASDHAVQLRVLATAADASKAWDLRCEIREKIVAFIQSNYPHCLPRVRAELKEYGKHSSPPHVPE